MDTLVAACVGPYLLVGKRLQRFRVALGTKLKRHNSSDSCRGKYKTRRKRKSRILLLVGANGVYMKPWPCRGWFSGGALKDEMFAWSQLIFADPERMRGWLRDPSSIQELFE